MHDFRISNSFGLAFLRLTFDFRHGIETIMRIIRCRIFSQKDDFTLDFQVKIPIEEPLALACYRTFYVDMPYILTTAWILISLRDWLFILFLFELQIGMKFVNNTRRIRQKKKKELESLILL